MKEIQYRPLGPEEITRDLFRSFERRQVETRTPTAVATRTSNVLVYLFQHSCS